jgi:hypothetical protein
MVPMSRVNEGGGGGSTSVGDGLVTAAQPAKTVAVMSEKYLLAMKNHPSCVNILS